MSLIELQAWLPGSDLSDAPDHTFASDDQLVDAGFNPVLWGEGDGFLEIHADDPDAQYLQRRGFIRAVRTDTNEGLFWWILEEGSIKLLSNPGKVQKVIRWDGRGMLYYLDRYKLGQAVWAPGQPHRGSVDVIDYWTWIDQAMISILTRFMEEGQFDTRADFLDKLDYDFNRTQDSNGNSLTDVSLYQVRIGTGGLTLAADAMRQGNLLQVLPESPPLLQAFRALSEYRTDRTSGTYAADKVRFAAGQNIATELPHKIVALRERTHTLTRRQDGQYATEALNGSGEPYMEFMEVPHTSDPDAVEAFVGESHLSRQKQSTVAVIRHKIGPGGTSGAQGYFPSPTGHYWLGDLVTAHNGSGEYDLNEQTLEVAGIRYFLRGADWMVEAQLGAQVINAAGAPVNIPNAGPTVPAGPRIELCQAGASAGTGDSVLFDDDFQDGDADIPAIPALDQPAVAQTDDINESGGMPGEWYAFMDNTGSDSSLPRGNYVLGAISEGQQIRLDWTHFDGGTGGSNRMGVVWVDGDWNDWQAHGRGAHIVSAVTALDFPDVSSITPRTATVTAPAGVSGFYINTTGAGTSSTFDLHSLTVTLLGDPVTFDGDGPEELVGTSIRAARCDHNHIVEGLLTEETDTALVLHPDGSGGIEWGTDATGGGGGGAHAVDHEDGGTDEIDITGLSGIPTELANHTADATDAHDASAVSVLDTAGNFTGTDVETVLDELADMIGAGGGITYVSGLRFAPLSHPSGTTNLAGTANAAYATQIIVPTHMVWTHLRVRFSVSGSGNWRWGLFQGDLDSLTLIDGDTVTPSAVGNMALGASAEKLFAAPGGPHNLDPGAYYLIFLQPAANASQLTGTSNAAMGDWLTHAATYTWTNTPDLTTVWTAYPSAVWVSIVGEDAQARVFPT